MAPLPRPHGSRRHLGAEHCADARQQFEPCPAFGSPVVRAGGAEGGGEEAGSTVPLLCSVSRRRFGTPSSPHLMSRPVATSMRREPREIRRESSNKTTFCSCMLAG